MRFSPQPFPSVIQWLRDSASSLSKAFFVCCAPFDNAPLIITDFDVALPSTWLFFAF
jgi:hypothetical protein